jgi:hypothetical protein
MTEFHEPQEHHLNVTEMRGAERQGLYKVLLVSTLLAVVALGGAWLVIGSQSSVSPIHVGPAPAPANP